MKNGSALDQMEGILIGPNDRMTREDGGHFMKRGRLVIPVEFMRKYALTDKKFYLLGFDPKKETLLVELFDKEEDAGPKRRAYLYKLQFYQSDKSDSATRTTTYVETNFRLNSWGYEILKKGKVSLNFDPKTEIIRVPLKGLIKTKAR